VLIADDEAAILFLFRRILSSSCDDIVVETVRDGRQAVECFREKKPAVVVLDLHMPVMDGITAFHGIESLCAREQRDMPKVIFCTGFAPPAILGDILQANPEHVYLPKPVSPATLVDTVRAGLSPNGDGP
jgi:CheY-like chemotaxis protein